MNFDSVREDMQSGRPLGESTRTLVFSLSLFAIALVIRVAHWLRAGYAMARTPPDTESYVSACTVLLSDPVSIVSNLKGPAYLGFTVPFCGFRAVVSESFQSWLAVQVLLSAVGVVLVYLTAKSVLGHGPGIVSALALAISYDAFKWDIAVLAESLTIFAVALSVWAYTMYRKNLSRRYRTLTGISWLWLALLRPHGVPVVVGWLVSDAVLARVRGTTPLVSSAYVTAGFVALLSLVPINTIRRGGAKSGSISGAWSEGWVIFKGKPRFFIPQYEPAAVTSSDPVEFLLNLPDLAILFTLRGLAFFNPIITFSYSGPDWRLFHTISLLAVIPLAIVGFGKLLYERRIELIQLWTIPMLMLLGVIVVSFISQTYRYRAAANPVFALLVGVAVSSLPAISVTD